jgi:tRNA dimethylallyltransferase
MSHHIPLIQNQKSLIVICGPTAVGKTSLSIDIAKHFDTEIISADSRQFYREMTIGTAKPTHEQLSEIKHHFINNLSIHDQYTAGMYEREVLSVLEILFATKDVAVMVGGSGLFIRAVCDGFDSFKSAEAPDESTKEKVRLMTLEQMQAEVEKLDREYYAKVDRQNPRRLQRALEVIYSTGQKYSAQRSGTKAPRAFKIIKLGLELPRAELNARIDQRVDSMMSAGQWAEAEALYQYRYLQPLQTVGYQEIFDSIEGTYDRSAAIHMIKQNTRQYAKRQMTWFRKDTDIRWFSPDDMAALSSFLDLHV